MKKMTLKMWLLGGIAALSMLATSCADGVDSEPFSAGVTNTQLESPAAESLTVSFVGSGENEQIKVSWTVVMGAGGYLCYAADVTDEANPVVVFEPKEIDGTSFQFPVKEDHTYLYSVKTLGNEQYKNTDAAEATGVRYFHGIVGEPIPAGSDIGAFIADYLAANAETLDASRKEDFNWELAFDLDPAGEYSLATAVDFGLIPVRLRTLNPERPATITYTEGGSGMITTQAGIRFQNLRIDATHQTGNGFIELSASPSDEILDANLIYMGGTTSTKGTYKELGAGKNAYIIEKPIAFQNVWIKNLPKSLVNSNATYAITDLRIVNSIIQIGANAKPFIYMQKGNQHMKNFIIQKSTIYSSTTFKQFVLALGNQNTTKVFGSVGAGGIWQVDQSTIYLFGNDKKGGDRVRDVASSNELTNSIFVNIRELAGGNGKLYSTPAVCTNNSVYHSNSDYALTPYDADGVNEAPAFVGDAAPTALDFAQENGGISFVPAGNALADRRGDPRWLPATDAE